MLGDKLKYLRSSMNKTQQQVADYLGITRAAYSHFENNRNDPDKDTLVKLANLFNVTTDYLLGRNHTPEWANKDEVMELDILLKSNIGMAYGAEGEITKEDREQINDLIASYFWMKKQKEAREKESS